jgi:flagellar motor switch protein FliG
MGLFQKKTKGDKLLSDMSDKQRKAKIDRLEEQRDDVVRRIEKLMFRISKEMRMRRLRDRKFPLGDSPNDRDSEE